MLARLCVIGVEPLIQISALTPMIAGDSVFGQLCVNLPGASSWTEWEGQAGFEAARGAQTVVYGRRTFLARSRAQLCWARRAKCTCETTSLLPSRRKARVTNATLATDKSVSRPLCLMWLRAMDLVLSTFGATRGGATQTVRSTARLSCPPS